MPSSTSPAHERVDAQQLRVLLRNPWFGKLPTGLRDDILARSVVRRFKAHSLVYATGSPSSGLYCVLSGEVRLEHHAASGKYAFYHAMPPGEFFGMLSELDGTPRFSDARAATDSAVLLLPHAELQQLYRRSAEARDAFVAFLCLNLHDTLRMLVEQHSAPPRTQIAHVLVTLFSHEAEPRGSSPKLTQETLAALAGVSRQTTNKVLREFRERGLVSTQYGKVAPVDLAALGELARGGVSR